MIVPIDYSNVFWRFNSINFISNVYIPKVIYGCENFIKVMTVHKKVVEKLCFHQQETVKGEYVFVDPKTKIHVVFSSIFGNKM